MKELQRPVTRKGVVTALQAEHGYVVDAAKFFGTGQTNLFKLQYMRRRADEMRHLVPGVIIGDMLETEKHFGVAYTVAISRAAHEGVTLAEKRMYHPEDPSIVGYHPVEGVMLGGLSDSGETVIVDVTRYTNPEYGKQGKPVDVYRIKNGGPTAMEGITIVEKDIREVTSIGHQPPTETILVGHTGFSHEEDSALARTFGIVDIFKR